VKRILGVGALILAAAALLLAIFHAAILTGLGNFLIRTEPPQKADVIVVLAGDGFGHRILKAAELVKEGYAPKALISGPDGNYGTYECDLAIPFAVKVGYPEAEFLHMENHARSTGEEAKVLVSRLREMGAKRVIVVTSNFHTRRSGIIFRRAAPDLQFMVVASPDEYFAADDWWRNREARKIFLYEWMKTVAEW
jgi:uncharacterized SAM-binding protein YcdF (DUF218 family)